MPDPEVDKSGLFNEISDGQVYPSNDRWYSHLLDQYKIYVEMADRISSRRATANSYFLSVNSAILAFVGYLSSKQTGEYLWLRAVAGIALSVLWEALITSYRNLNTAKFLVIHKIEKRLPISPMMPSGRRWDAERIRSYTDRSATSSRAYHTYS
jgi:hypothetical protein